MTRKTIVFIAIAAFIWFLILVVGKLPAALVINNLANEFGVFTPSNIRGTIWQGQASVRITSLQPSLDIKKATWNISPIKLLLGEFDATISLKDGLRQLAGNIQFDIFSHDMTLSKVKGKVDTALLQPYLDLPFKVSGLVDLDLKTLSMVDMKPTKLDGRVIIESLSLDMGQNIELGTFAADLSLMDDKPVVLAKLQDVNAVVSLSGQVQLQPSPSVDYFVDLHIKPKEQANPIIDNTLKNFYRADANGSYHVTLGQKLN